MSMAGQLPSYDEGLPRDISSFLRPVQSQKTLGYFRLLASLSRDAYWIQGRKMEPRAFVNRYGMILVTHSLMLAEQDPDAAEELEQFLLGDGMSTPRPAAAIFEGGGVGAKGAPVAEGVYLSATATAASEGNGQGAGGGGGDGVGGGGAAPGRRGVFSEAAEEATPAEQSLKQSLVERLERLNAALDEIADLQSRDLYFETTQEDSGDAGYSPVPPVLSAEDRERPALRAAAYGEGRGGGGEALAQPGEEGAATGGSGGGMGDVVSAVTSAGVTAATSTIGFALSMVGGDGDNAPGSSAPMPEPFMCEWFVADDSTGLNRLFVVEGSDSVDSWKSNLTFEPAEFEGLSGVTVHRGMYDAAKGLYHQFLPIALEHLAQGPEYCITFTGHSLGGSLGMLLALMMVHRGDVSGNRIKDVVCFAGPSIFAEACSACGASTHGDHRCKCVRAEAAARQASLLHRVGFPAEKIKNICMSNDIVPRALSCDYSPVQPILRKIRGSLKDHPCLSGAHGKRPTLFAPIGRTFVLQPSPQLPFINDGDRVHPMMPQGESLYEICDPAGAGRGARARLFGLLARGGIGPSSAVTRHPSRGELAAAAASAGEADSGVSARPAAAALGEPAVSSVEAVAEYLNTPHPLTNLADPASYGHHGAISRYHNPRSYFWALSSLLRSAKCAGGDGKR